MNIIKEVQERKGAYRPRIIKYKTDSGFSGSKSKIIWQTPINLFLEVSSMQL